MLKSKPILILLIIAGLITIGLNVITFEEIETKTGPKTYTMDKTVSVKQGDYFTYEFKVNSVNQNAEGTIVSLNATAKNLGDKELDFSYVSFYLLDDSDEEVASTMSATTPTSLALSLKKDMDSTGDLYFSAPASYSKLKMVVPDYETGQEEISYIITLNK